MPAWITANYLGSIVSGLDDHAGLAHHECRHLSDNRRQRQAADIAYINAHYLQDIWQSASITGPTLPKAANVWNSTGTFGYYDGSNVPTATGGVTSGLATPTMVPANIATTVSSTPGTLIAGDLISTVIVDPNGTNPVTGSYAGASTVIVIDD